MKEPLKIVLDTNNMNAYGSSLELNFIENCENEGFVEIYYGADTSHDLEQDASRNPIRLNKIRSKKKVYSTGRFDYSFFPFILAGDPSLDDEIALLIFGKKWAEIEEKRPDTMNSKVDVKLIEASIIGKINYFVTEDKVLLKKSEEIYKRYGLKIVNRETMKEFLILVKN
ncbi:MAG: hypothetical protein ABSE07_12145 [Methanoregula sp.]|jgi:hypothetical protein